MIKSDSEKLLNCSLWLKNEAEQQRCLARKNIVLQQSDGEKEFYKAIKFNDWAELVKKAVEGTL